MKNNPEIGTDAAATDRGGIGALARYLSENGLPAIIAGPAGKALSRLIGGAVDIPAAGLERLSARIRSRTEAERTVAHKLAEAVGDRAASDTLVVDRALDQWLGTEIRRQQNREAVATETIEHLKSEPSPTVESPGPTEDWMNQFEEYAEKASSDELRSLWARVLAGEIRKPKSFSPRTLHFMATIDQETAKAVEIIYPYIFCIKYIPSHQKIIKEIGFENLLIAEDAGILRGVGGNLVVQLNKKGRHLHGKEAFGIREPEGIFYSVIKDGEQADTITIPSMPLTQIGKEIIPLIKFKPNIDRLELIASIIKQNKFIERVELVELVGEEGSLQFGSTNVFWDRTRNTN